MARVLVLGPSGAGKSTFARRLGGVIGVPVVHLDQLLWEPGWRQVPQPIFRDRVAAAAAGESWIIDGNSPSTLDLRLPRATRVVLFDRSRLVCYARVFRRVAFGYGRVRPDMAPGCPERFDWEFLRYIWDFPRLYQPRVLAALKDHGAMAMTTVVRRDRDAEEILVAASADT